MLANWLCAHAVSDGLAVADNHDGRTCFMKLLVAITFLLSSAFPSIGEAKLKPTTLDALIAESELILEASPRRIERMGMCAGEATLKVMRVIHGTYDRPEVQIKWSEEIHDQPIANLEQDWLLFLKKNDQGGYSGTHYGRSYWPFLWRVTDLNRADLDSSTRTLPYLSPLTLVTFSAAQQKALFQRSQFPYGGRNVRVISFPKLKAFIVEQRKSLSR
jgi:hypothetical protein